MENANKNETSGNFIETSDKSQSWAKSSENIDSPRYGPLDSLYNLPIPPLQLDPKPTQNMQQWRRNPPPDDTDQNFSFDLNVSNIDLQVTKGMVRSFFKHPPTSIVMRNVDSRQNATVSFKTREEAQAALFLNGKIPMNCYLQTQKLVVTHPSKTTPPLMDTPTSQPRFRNFPTSANPRDSRSTPKPLNPQDGKTMEKNKFNNYGRYGSNFIKPTNVLPENGMINPKHPYLNDGSKFKTISPSSSVQPTPVEQKARVPLNLAKRTIPIDQVASVPNSRNTAIFGNAQPIVDSVSSGVIFTKGNETRPSTVSTTQETSESKKESFKHIEDQSTISLSKSQVNQSNASNKDQIKDNPAPTKTFLHGGGDEIKRRINADHVAPTTSTRVKSNPYGQATPVLVRDITEIRKEKGWNPDHLDGNQANASSKSQVDQAEKHEDKSKNQENDKDKTKSENKEKNSHELPKSDSNYATPPPPLISFNASSQISPNLNTTYLNVNSESSTSPINISTNSKPTMTTTTPPSTDPSTAEPFRSRITKTAENPWHSRKNRQNLYTTSPDSSNQQTFSEHQTALSEDTSNINTINSDAKFDSTKKGTTFTRDFNPDDSSLASSLRTQRNRRTGEIRSSSISESNFSSTPHNFQGYREDKTVFEKNFKNRPNPTSRKNFFNESKPKHDPYTKVDSNKFMYSDSNKNSVEDTFANRMIRRSPYPKNESEKPRQSKLHDNSGNIFSNTDHSLETPRHVETQNRYSVLMDENHD